MSTPMHYFTPIPSNYSHDNDSDLSGRGLVARGLRWVAALCGRIAPRRRGLNRRSPAAVMQRARLFVAAGSMVRVH